MQQRILLERRFLHGAVKRFLYLRGLKQHRLLQRHGNQNAQLRLRHGVELRQLELRFLLSSQHADGNWHGYGNYDYKLLGLPSAVLQRHYAKVSQQIHFTHGHLLRHNSYQYRHYDLRQLRGVYFWFHFGLYGLYVSNHFGIGLSGCGRRYPK